VRLTTLPPSCAVVTISGSLNFLEPSLHLGPVMGLIYHMLYYWEKPPTKSNRRMNGAQIKYYTRFLSAFYIHCCPHLHLPCVAGSAEYDTGARSLGNYLCCSVTPCAIKNSHASRPLSHHVYNTVICRL